MQYPTDYERCKSQAEDTQKPHFPTTPDSFPPDIKYLTLKCRIHSSLLGKYDFLKGNFPLQAPLL